MTTNEITRMTETDEVDVLSTLQITKTTRRREDQGLWVEGTIDGHRFEALVWPDHASNPDYELGGDSRITKLWLQHNGKTAACFDRGWDARPKTASAARIIDLLAAGLAEHVFNE